MIFTLQPFLANNELLLTFRGAAEDEIRAIMLARALRGRFIPASSGWALKPYDATRWKMLFKAGFTAKRRTARKYYGWWFWRPDVGNADAREAMRIVRREAPKPKVLEGVV